MSIQELQQIKGIGSKYARMLHDAGITNLVDLAASAPDHLHEIIQARGGLAHYDDWIQQARELTGLEKPEALEASQEQVEIQAALKDLVAELNDLAAQLKQLEPYFQPPQYSPQRMKTVLAENLERFTPETIKSLQESVEGTSIEDFKDIETWKGVWFTINYLIKLEARERASSLAKRLAQLPGVTTLADLKEMLQDTPPEEFLNPETWKGVWFLVNYELKNAASDIKKRVQRKSEDAEAEEADWEDWEDWED